MIPAFSLPAFLCSRSSEEVALRERLQRTEEQCSTLRASEEQQRSSLEETQAALVEAKLAAELARSNVEDMQQQVRPLGYRVVGCGDSVCGVQPFALIYVLMTHTTHMYQSSHPTVAVAVAAACCK